MAVKFTKPEINVREKLAELDKAFRNCRRGECYVLRPRRKQFNSDRSIRRSLTALTQVSARIVDLNTIHNPKILIKCFFSYCKCREQRGLLTPLGELLYQGMVHRVGVGDTYAGYSGGVLFRGMLEIGHAGLQPYSGVGEVDNI